ncbi:MAG: hypothetical protein JWP48_1095 [Actinoallomurus sp.]|jgi:hypothetical protein|nr:hypothetical protein [Actinoallomurus sp.]
MTKAANPSRSGAVQPRDYTGRARQIARLEALPSGANMIEPERWCALESGNAGSHFALGQASGDEEFWIQWVEGDSNNCQ